MKRLLCVSLLAVILVANPAAADPPDTAALYAENCA